MAIKVRTQKSYYVTEFTVELPAHIGELHDVLKAIKTTGKTIVQYNDGSVLGINVEQKEKIPSEEIDAQIRALLGLETKFL
jgi:hypothetical protein